MAKPKLACENPYDDDDEGPLSQPRKWTTADQLTPTPPSKGWLVLIYLTSVPQHLELGCWIVALTELAAHEKQLNKRLHMIARQPDGTRWLLVHPRLLGFVRELIEELNGRMTQCNCGGGDCLAGHEAFKALRVRARRAWRRHSYGERIKIQQEACLDQPLSIAYAMDDSAAFMDLDFMESRFFEEITGAC